MSFWPKYAPQAKLKLNSAIEPIFSSALHICVLVPICQLSDINIFLTQQPPRNIVLDWLIFHSNHLKVIATTHTQNENPLYDGFSLPSLKKQKVYTG